MLELSTRSNIKKFAPCSLLLTPYLLLLSTHAYAVSVGVEIPGTTGTSFTYKTYMSAILKFSLRIGFALAVLMIVYAGIKYLTSQGNQTQINDAKEILLGAIIGFTMLILISVILSFLGIPFK